MRIYRFAFSTIAILLLTVACGKESGSGESLPVDLPPAKSLQCNSRPSILTENENARFSFLPHNVEGDMVVQLISGLTLLEQNWGTASLASDSALEANYTAPAFIPETRRLDIQANIAGTQGSCGVHVLAAGDKGVKDDGEVIGIPIAIYAKTAAPTGFSDVSGISPAYKTVTRALDFDSTPTAGSGVALPIAGVVSLTQNFEIRSEAVLKVTSAQGYRFKLTGNNNQVEVTIGATVLKPTSGNAVTADVNLSPGSYPVSIKLWHATGNLRLKLEWATKASGYTPFTTVPAAAFDRK